MNLKTLYSGPIVSSLLIVVAVAGCNPSNPNVVKRPGEPDMLLVTKKDAEMNAAIAKARKTVKTFLTALKAPKPGQGSFSVKKPFPTGKGDDQGQEHIWLSDISFDGKLIHGKVGNDPVEVQNIKYGDPVTISPTEISDWLYADKGKLVGGYTLRVLYNRSSPEEKKQLDDEIGLKIN